MSSLKDYLKRYTGSNNDDSSGKSKKSTRKRKASEAVVTGVGVVIVDDDVAWHKNSKPDYDDAESPEAGEELPAVVEDVEMKRMQRMEALKTFRPYLAVADDGSGWVTVRDDALEPASIQDLSPPRKKNGFENDSKIVPPFPRKRYDSPDETHHRSSTAGDDSNGSGDLSPPRKKLSIMEMARGPSHLQKKNDSASVSSPEKRRHDSPDETPRRTARSDDTSPLRVRRTSNTAPDTNEHRDLSPPRRKIPVRDPAEEENVSTLVFSLERRNPPVSRDSPVDLLGRTAKSEDSSPPISRRRSSAARNTIESWDLSPPRRKHPNRESAQGSSSLQRRNDSTLLSPRDKRRHDSPDDLRRKSDDSSRVRKTPSAAPDKNDRRDLSPPRKKLYMRDNTQDDSTLVTPRDTRGHNFPDASRRRTAMSDDSSPAMARWTPTDESRDLSPLRKKLTRKMADGTFAGLKTEREVVSEAERKKADEEKFLLDLDPSLSGRGAKTVFRDKRGRRLEGMEELLRQQKSEAKSAEEPLEWGKGVAQKREIASKVAELEAEKNKPFARYRDDAELDKSLKERIRWGDPMAHLVKRKAEEPELEDFSAREEMKASGFIIPQDIPNHSWLKRGIAPPPNRYGIKPGRHWDGVDRSTGFEQGLSKQKNEKKARELEAYLWSVSDM